MHVVVIILANFTREYSVYSWFRLNGEQNFPTYFSSINLLLSSLLLYFIYRYYKNNALSDGKYWIVLSIIFLCLSIDDFICFHEKANLFIASELGREGVFYYPWVILAIVIILILAVFYFRFFLRLPRRYKVLFALSAFLFIGGAVGMEMVTGYLDYLAAAKATSWLRVVTGTIEDSMEILGVILFLYSLTDYIDTHLHPVSPPANG